MKNISILITVVLSSLVFTGCDPYADDFTPSRITVYPEILLEGDQTMFVNVGEEFQDPGAETDTGDPITSSGNVDTSSPGVYTIKYSAINDDGFETTATRTIYVSNTGDFNPSIEGVYLSDVIRRESGEAYEDLKYARIWRVEDNKYELSHAVGGFYSKGRKYGEDYSAGGAIITDNGDGTYTVEDAYIPGFDLVITVSSFTVDEETKTITYTGSFGSSNFDVTLDQLQF